jgi:hypothetical protein
VRDEPGARAQVAPQGVQHQQLGVKPVYALGLGVAQRLCNSGCGLGHELLQI